MAAVKEDKVAYYRKGGDWRQWRPDPGTALIHRQVENDRRLER